MSLNSEMMNQSAVLKGGRQISLSCKRILDLLVAITALLMISPLLATLVLIILVTQGRPVIYQQQRVGVNGTRFFCLKLRSMVRDADQILDEHLAKDSAAAAEWASKHKLMNDPRVTKLGQFLRRSSLDELPQLINIIKGEMSLVGPRPIVTNELVRYGDLAPVYLGVRPGLTGLWQVDGRSDSSYQDRVKLDCEYVWNWTFFGDLMIIAKTLPAVILRRGAV